ncbi:MAG: prolyl oligopeptidase family serine peptidase [Verrucomicrobiae bacterium]|nr:prolyl oligopeptidase family serine peptidase [Verrucomicrobiae bacterium]
MRRILAGSVILSWGLAPGSAGSKALYEEDLLASMEHRVLQWQQTDAYVRAQEAAPPDPRPSPGSTLSQQPAEAETATAVDPQSDNRTRFGRRIGYPPPGFLSQYELRLETVGSDTVATYHRCRIQVTPQIETYGLYIVPQPARPARHPSGAIPPCGTFTRHRRWAPPESERASSLPLVIAQHGGGGYPELATFRGGGNYHDLVRGAVEQGWAVFAPQLLFYPFGDRDHGTPIPPDVRARFDTRLRQHGTSLAAVEVRMITAALDALLQRPELDPERVAMVGLSYCGFYTLYTAALDPRIGAAASSCAFVDWGTPAADFAAPQEWTAAGVLNDATPAALAGLICPRPLLIQAGVHDPLFKIDPTREMVAAAAGAYERLGGSGRLEFVEFKGGHEFHGKPVWDFFRRSWAAR